MWMVVFGHHDYRLPSEGSVSALVHRVSADAGCGGAGPVHCVPCVMVGQTLHRAHILRKVEEKDEKNCQHRNQTLMWIRALMTELMISAGENLLNIVSLHFDIHFFLTK